MAGQAEDADHSLTAADDEHLAALFVASAGWRRKGAVPVASVHKGRASAKPLNPCRSPHARKCGLVDLEVHKQVRGLLY